MIIIPPTVFIKVITKIPIANPTISIKNAENTEPIEIP